MNQPSILVVDDEPDNFDVIEALLSDLGYDLHYASNGNVALNSLDVFQPDVILMDVMMPDLDGMEVCQRIKAQPQWEGVPIIMVTALSAKEDLARCIKAGADDFISKPVSGLELRARVHSMLRLKQQYDKIRSLSKVQESTIDLLQKNLNELSGNLASSLPHELNTPLNGIFGVIGLLLDDREDMSEEEIHELLLLAQQSALRLDRLTKKFLIYIKLELMTSQIPMDKTPTNNQVTATKSVIENCAMEQAKKVDRQNDLICELEDIAVPVSEDNLKWMVDELLENAFKFSTPLTPVKVSSQLIKGAFHLSISDRGRGMTEEQISKIGAFMQFERRTYEQQGLGLGLKIVKKIIDISAGEFYLSSVYHEETTAHITLPSISE
ncbi:MAG: hybrid sensor histidine kinase/response regulator [Oscillatoriales cyanobacterium]|uniref:histidine kinase n=1 Tax=Microcoleus anatoxicus PTRS2 TaxID=2705321 RepID=A0ABU8YK39_9CYAN|nr:MAG: hybrid sensor histidine kinase/response regulator [Oscillatoriales cyanobacterium]TAD98116.1 MAG: hybrid sensor histidine kinase/response regulator [Oscillatoriales cyanobacterium]TAE06135.1 MAG: hybrid sensor histidine kinase/response regulator [Oscillatoriales cyanobacterium]TAF06203.1 MAG: hybrid sensor histidine kinase/response regulator [Oscillatoriales cyanobacterium]TAF47689.1 MAG: hybrid sensor histidine kinase/response regulator [Oscillatoriales cyanobacterium]